MALTGIRDFALANPAYVGASVAFYVVDPATGLITATLADLFGDPLGQQAIANPQPLDSYGKFPQPVYCGVAVIGVTSGTISVPSHSTGIIFPAGTFRGIWVTGTIYFPGDTVGDGANGTNTGNIYGVTSYHVSVTWAADSINPAKLVLELTNAGAANAAQAARSAVLAGMGATQATTSKAQSAMSATDAAASAAAAAASAASINPAASPLFLASHYGAL